MIVDSSAALDLQAPVLPDNILQGPLTAGQEGSEHASHPSLAGLNMNDLDSAVDHNVQYMELYCSVVEDYQYLSKSCQIQLQGGEKLKFIS